MSNIIAAYDFGTSGVKVVLFGFDGHIYSISEQGYTLIRPRENWVEQDPSEYWRAVCGATREAIAAYGGSPNDIKAINFSVQVVNLIPVDEKGNPLYNAVSWLDGRATKQAKEINRTLGFDAVNNQAHQSRLLWFKEERPDIYDNAAFFLDCNGFLQYKSTGIMAVNSNSNAVVQRNPEIEAFLAMVDEAAGISGKMPPVVDSTKVYGYVDGQGEKDLGIPYGTPVFGGCNDVAAAAAGAGCFKEGDANIYLGSSGWLSAIVKNIKESEPGSYHIPSIDPRYLIYGGCINSCCTAVNWLINLMYSSEKEKMGDGVWDVINRDLNTISPGCDGLRATPWLYGEQFPVNSSILRATFLNINGNHTRAHMITALIESICYSLRWQIEIFERDHGIKINKVTANGGGSLSEPWIQRMTDILGVDVLIPDNARHSGAIGVAIAAAVGLGICTFNTANDLVKTSKEYHPNKDVKKLYDKHYGDFKYLVEEMMQIYEKFQRV